MNVLKKLRDLFEVYKLDGYIVPKNDEFFGEYVNKKNDRLNFISLFSGSAGFGLVLKKKAYLFVDGRYTLQAKKETNKNFKIIEIHKTKPSEIIAKINQKLRIGFDPKLFSEAFLINNFKTKNTTLIPIKNNLVDEIWSEKPKLKVNKFFILSSKHAGRDHKSKINTVCKILEEKTQKAINLFLKIHPNSKYLAISGGVASNSNIKETLESVANKNNLSLVVPPSKLCTDNGVMIAWAGIEHKKIGYETDHNFDVRSRWPLGENCYEI